MVCAKETVNEHVGVTEPAHGPVVHDANLESEEGAAAKVIELPLA